ncbi:hypothetical protein CAOG_08972, partial [Capsaspora owczarzaki ATCC 30864]|uniref:hypothetical protein n=1 Tax=Capsaspora owczarzaki (strain ATCC 30864) TaxID=595528 RepID=UPI0003526211
MEKPAADVLRIFLNDESYRSVRVLPTSTAAEVVASILAKHDPAASPSSYSLYAIRKQSGPRFVEASEIVQAVISAGGNQNDKVTKIYIKLAQEKSGAVQRPRPSSELVRAASDSMANPGGSQTNLDQIGRSSSVDDSRSSSSSSTSLAATSATSMTLPPAAPASAPVRRPDEYFVNPMWVQTQSVSRSAGAALEVSE